VGYDAAIASFLLVSWSLWLPNFYFQIYAFMNSRLKDHVSCAAYYDYLDAILKTTNSGRSVRLFMDLDFTTQFEIARPTREYRALLELLPKIYVGRGDRLQSIVKIMCDGVKNSLNETGMHLPHAGDTNTN
jgi:uncharacterized protein (TIGR01615 family)